MKVTIEYWNDETYEVDVEPNAGTFAAEIPLHPFTVRRVLIEGIPPTPVTDDEAVGHDDA